MTPAPESSRPHVEERFLDGGETVVVFAVCDTHVVARWASKPHPPEVCPLVYTRAEFQARCVPAP